MLTPSEVAVCSSIGGAAVTARLRAEETVSGRTALQLRVGSTNIIIIISYDKKKNDKDNDVNHSFLTKGARDVFDLMVKFSRRFDQKVKLK